METQQAKFDGWAIVDVLGHQRYVGYVTTEAYGQAVLFRIDVPALEARERVTKQPGRVGDRYVPAGTSVLEGAVDGYTKLIGAGSIYAITPCTQEAALKAVEAMQPRPLMSVQLPPERALEPGEPPSGGFRDIEFPDDPNDTGEYEPDDEDEDDLDDSGDEDERDFDPGEDDRP
jgi:hypothetical protein